MAGADRGQLAASEAEIQALVEADKREEAGEKLFDLIITCARSGDIANANRLRDMLYDVDPMALNAIIKANEIIDEAMSGSIGDEFLKAWAALQEALTEDEFKAFYHALERHEVEAGKTVVAAGSKLDALFLVTRGNIRVSFSGTEGMAEAKTLEPGMMIGENIFQPSLWTVTLTTLTPAELHVLRLKNFLSLMESFPGLESKLTGFYRRYDDIPAILAEKEVQRRVHKRFRVDRRITFQLVGREGNVDERSYRGELDNISQGGLAFLMRIVKRENRWQLRGRKILVTIPLEETKLTFSGTVVAVSVQDLQNHDYAIHLAFDEPVSEEVFRPMVLPEPDEEVLPEDGQGLEEDASPE
ncbi:MAG: hypothetical protein Kow0089_24970 [Desulfobulbaceae bacterium]